MNKILLENTLTTKCMIPLQYFIIWATAMSYSCMVPLDNWHYVSFPKKQQRNAQVKFQTNNLAVIFPSANQLSYALPTVIQSQISV